METIKKETTKNEKKLPFRFQDKGRDLEILKYIYEHRFLQTHQVQQLTTGSDQVISRRLQKLSEYGYLDEIKTALHEKNIYALGNNGADALTESTGIDRGKINWQRKNLEVRNAYVNHTLMIANFRIALALALEGTGTELCRWIPESAEIKDKVKVRMGSRMETVPVNPDAYIILKEIGEEAYTNFFLEADQGTMDNPRFLRKLQAYWAFYRQERHKEKFEIDGFRVLTICKSRKRADNLRRTAKKADDNKKGSRMFWFASEERYNSEEPATILKSIWQTPKDDTVHHLLEES